MNYSEQVEYINHSHSISLFFIFNQYLFFSLGTSVLTWVRISYFAWSAFVSFWANLKIKWISLLEMKIAKQTKTYISKNSTQVARREVDNVLRNSY